MSSEAESSHTQRMDTDDSRHTAAVSVTIPQPYPQHADTVHTARTQAGSRHTGDAHISTNASYINGDVGTPTFNINLPPPHTQVDATQQQRQQAPPSYHTHHVVHAPAEQSAQ